MNIREGLGILRGTTFRTALAARRLLPRQSISAFGLGDDRIGLILAINLDRQPERWRQLTQELDRFKGSGGESLADLAQRMPAIDARDGRETAPTADVDPIYPMRDQLFVQPDPRLEECFGQDEPIRMTRQEIAVARSHIEAWKRIAQGPDENVLVLEDDVYFVAGAAQLIDRGWRAAMKDRSPDERLQLLYLSYLDAGGTAQRADVSTDLFRPVRGFWYLSGYVLSRSGAESLLRSMPVVGPVDLWMNRRFSELAVLALSRPALLQRPDGGSDNAYSILPYLSRSGTVDAGPKPVHASVAATGLVFAWNSPGSTDAVGMALSSLGFRVRTFSKSSALLEPAAVPDIFGSAFDAYVDPPLDEPSLRELVRLRPDAKFVLANPTDHNHGSAPIRWDALRQVLPEERTTILPDENDTGNRWQPLCDLLGLQIPDHAFPRGCAHEVGLFQASSDQCKREDESSAPQSFDQSPWVLIQGSSWRPRLISTEFQTRPKMTEVIVDADLSSPSAAFRNLTETFPGNMAAFERGGVEHGADGATLVLRRGTGTIRPLTSGALASMNRYLYGRFEANIRSARGAGLITGFFLHRDLPRQEIDIELLGSDPSKMLTNVYFNPGDEGTAIGYGYRGTPHIVDLGFDASADFHTYAIEWGPDCIRWLVDNRIVHERPSWDPTPIPHLPMQLYANLWSPRSIELAGQLRDGSLPASSTFRRISVRTLDDQIPLKQASSETPPRALQGDPAQAYA
jgi:GR25 family glycosyltransferase involved in LPS biosynthesis